MAKAKPALTNLQKAQAAWQPLPDWIAALAERCDQDSQRAVAERLGIDHGAISAVINRKYRGNLLNIAERVRRHYMPQFIEIAHDDANLRKAQAAWHPLPPWVRVLAEHCDREGQQRVGQRLRYSASVVSTVLGNSYQGDMRAVQMIVRGSLMDELKPCPVFGDVNMTSCYENQTRPVTLAQGHFLRRVRENCKFCSSALRNLPPHAVREDEA